MNGPESDQEVSSRGYQRLLDRHPELRASIAEFEQWLQSVEIWLHWIERHIPNDAYASRSEVLDDFHFSRQGLELLERLHLDIYADHDGQRTMYDVKKLLRAVVALPTIARLKGKKLIRKNQNITTIFKEVIDDTLCGTLDIDSISSWSPADASDGTEAGPLANEATFDLKIEYSDFPSESSSQSKEMNP